MFKKSFGFFQDRAKRNKSQRVDSDSIGVDVMAEQVKKMLQASDQKIILMVRG